MNPKLLIIRLLIKKEIYDKYRQFIPVDDDRNVETLYKALDDLFTKVGRDVSLDELKAFLDVSGATTRDKERVIFEQFFKVIEEAQIGEELLHELLEQIKVKEVAEKLGVASFDFATGRGPIDNIHQLYTRLESVKEHALHLDFVTDDLEVLYEETIHTPGLRWRLPSLNRMLGSLRTGDFGFIFARPESFSRDTEVLTPNGWVTVDKVTKETYISQVNPDLTTTFVRPEAIHPHEQTHCYHIHDELGRVDLIVTEGHGMIYEKDRKLWKERADTIKYYQGRKHHVSAATSLVDSVDFLPEHRLAIAYQADGHTRNYKEYGYTFSFKKERKQQRLKEILDECGYEYSEYKDGNRGHKGYYVKSKIRLYKNFDWINLSRVSKEWCQQFIEELSYWDATRRTDTRFKFDTTNRSVADKVQAIAILAGYNCLLSVCIDHRSPNYNDVYSLTIRANYQPVDGQCIVKERIPFTDTTYCFEVPSGMLLVRRNGAVAVSGNTGKTTFLASEVTFFAEQVDHPILWFNNEEQGNKVMLRCYEASLGVPLHELTRRRQESQREYYARTKRNIKIFDDAALSRKTIESLCREHSPSLVVIDQIDKLKGFDGDREDLKLGAIYQWARELAKTYCPVIAVCQADGTGEGVKWLNMSHVANAKTSKQAEADFIIGIGKTNEQGRENSRFINISKNKLQGDEDSDPAQRHGFCEVVIVPEVARYREIGEMI